MFPSTLHCWCAVLWDTVISVSLQISSYPGIPDDSTTSTCCYHSRVVKCAANKENTFLCFVLSSWLSSYLLIDKYGKIILFSMYIFKSTLYLLFYPHLSQDRELSVLLQKQSGKLWVLMFNNIIGEIWIPQAFFTWFSKCEIVLLIYL